MVSATLVSSHAVSEIAAARTVTGHKMPFITPKYGVASYRLTYKTLDGYGQLVTASGLVSVPAKALNAQSPLLSYQHGTIFKDAEAPSNAALPSEPPIALASQGYIVIAADYVGYGASRGNDHPYLLSGPTAASVVDLLTAARTWRNTIGLRDNGQLFLAGYSEGGYATVATHRALQTGVPNSLLHYPQLVSSVTGAGPNHVGVTLDAVLDRVRQENPLVGALISPGFLSQLGSTLRNEVRRLILKTLMPSDSEVNFQPRFLDNYLADDAAAIERDSNVHAWGPLRGLRLFHGRDDELVSYRSSTVTLAAMQAAGSVSVSLTDCAATPSSHSGCVTPYFQFALPLLAAAARDL